MVLVFENLLSHLKLMKRIIRELVMFAQLAIVVCLRSFDIIITCAFRKISLYSIMDLSFGVLLLYTCDFSNSHLCFSSVMVRFISLV